MDQKNFNPDNRPVRVRIAPSPTGNCHVGTARTALYNLLFARKYKGKFVLRIDDTDLKRSTKESEEGVLEGLKWLGIKWDEGPDINGPFAPYRQMERYSAYRACADKLLAEGRAYKCYCSPEELEAQRNEAMAKGTAPRYYGKCANLTQRECEKYEAEGRKPVIRLRVPDKIYSFEDMIRGVQTKNMGERGDFVIMKSDGSPIYNFATVIDECDMQISHVFRAVEHLSNTYDQLCVYEALGYKAPMFGHLTLMLNPDKSKISKRAGAIYVGEFKEMGYLPEAVVNFLALLGWNPGDDREIFNMDELIAAFSVETLSKSDAVFDIKKLDWFNGVYIRNLTMDELLDRIMPFMEKTELVRFENDQYLSFTGKVYEKEAMIEMVKMINDRIGKLTEAPEMLDFLFKDELTLDLSLFKAKNGASSAEIGSILKLCTTALESLPIWDKESMEAVLKAECEKAGWKIGDMLMQVRVAITSKKVTPPLFESMILLGKDISLGRLNKAADALCAV